MRRPHLQSHVTHQPRGHVKNQKQYISTFTGPMYPKLSRVVTQDAGTPTTKSRNTSILWSRGKQKALYFPFHKAYGPQTWLGLTQDERTLPKTSPDTSITWSCVKSKRFVSTFTRSTLPELGMVLNQDDGAPPKTSRNISVVWSREKSKPSYFLNHWVVEM